MILMYHQKCVDDVTTTNSKPHSIMLPSPHPKLENIHYSRHLHHCGSRSPQQVSLLHSAKDAMWVLPLSPLDVLIVLSHAVQNLMGVIVSIAIEASHSTPFMLLLLCFSKGREVALALFVLDVRTRLESIQSNLFMTTAEKQCDKFQVKIVIKCDGKGDKGGYGVVVWRNGALYLKSCYHVFSDARSEFGDITSDNVEVTIAFRNEPALPIRLNSVFFPSRLALSLHYIDVCLYSFRILGNGRAVADHETVTAETKSLQGRKVLASSKTRMEGSANELKDPYEYPDGSSDLACWCEFLVNATAMPGCSGSPMFDVDGYFIGLIKGSVRGRSADFSLSAGNAQSSCLGVSSMGLEFSMVKKDQQHILDGLMQFKRKKSIDITLREILEDCLITDCGAGPSNAEALLEGYQKDLKAMHDEDQRTISFPVGKALQLVKGFHLGN